MSITTQQLADIVGVSRGTVDRVLNNRGRVSAEMRARVEAAAREHGYVPAAMGRALARAKRPIKLGVVLHLAELPFARQMLEGVRQAEAELSKLGGVVLTEVFEGLEPAAHIRAVERLVAQGIEGLAITPVEDAGLAALLNRLAREQKLEIVTLNTNIKGLERSAFVGLDNYRSGQAAAGLLHLMLGPAGGKVLVVNGTLVNRTNSQRVEGFLQVLDTRYPTVQVVGIQFSQDEADTAHRLVAEALDTHPDLAAIFMVSGGQAGACRALEEAGRAQAVRLVVYDTLPETVEYIKKGVIDMIIDQDAHRQGELPLRMLFDALFAAKPMEARVYTEIKLKTEYNL